MLVKKKIWSEKRKNYWSNLVREKIFIWKKIVDRKKNFSPKKVLVQKKNFKRNYVRKILVQNLIQTSKLFQAEHFKT